MAVRVLTRSIIQQITKYKPSGSAGAHDTIRSVIGNREIVGFGINGQPEYVDRHDFPMPAIRWKETTPDVIALREKEKGDWRKLSIDEKKCLYRTSFRQTFAEFTYPKGEWKSIVGCAVFFATFGIIAFIWEKLFVYNNQPLPVTLTEEGRAANLRHILDAHIEIITGISSQWDYENDTWKK